MSICAVSFGALRSVFPGAGDAVNDEDEGDDEGAEDEDTDAVERFDDGGELFEEITHMSQPTQRVIFALLRKRTV